LTLPFHYGFPALDDVTQVGLFITSPKVAKASIGYMVNQCTLAQCLYREEKDSLLSFVYKFGWVARK
jgi:hypothetical protein